MGDQNQAAFVIRHADKVRPPVLEVGSRDYGNSPNYRELLAIRDYVGIDLGPGERVDVVLDLTWDADAVDEALNGERFNTVICQSVLEHCANPFQMCANIDRLLRPSGILFISVPFAWRIHGYPSDYWRFTPDGVKVLFPRVEFIRGALSTSSRGETGPIDDYMLRIELGVRAGLSRGLFWRPTGLLIALLRRMGQRKGLGYLGSIFTYPHLFPPTMINMVGRKKE